MVNIHTVTLDDTVYPLGYKVVTRDLESLGLRGNPSIIQYPIHDWAFLHPDECVKGPGDYGGMWVTRTLSGASKVKKYMQEKHSQETRVFKAALDDILYCNEYRIKTNGLNMFEEVFWKR